MEFLQGFNTTTFKRCTNKVIATTNQSLASSRVLVNMIISGLYLKWLAEWIVHCNLRGVGSIEGDPGTQQWSQPKRVGHTHPLYLYWGKKITYT